MARANIQYKGSRDGVKALLKSAEVQEMLDRRAEKVREAATAAAPVGEDRPGRPHLRDRIKIDRTPGKDRARARVVADTVYASRIDTAWLARSLDEAVE